MYIPLDGQATALRDQGETNLMAVVSDVDSKYRTKKANGRVLMGDSMGGEAAIRLALKYSRSRTFGAALATDPGAEPS